MSTDKTFGKVSNENSQNVFKDLWLNDILLHYPNIVIQFLDEEKYFENTPFEEWYKGRKVL